MADNRRTSDLRKLRELKAILAKADSLSAQIDEINQDIINHRSRTKQEITAKHDMLFRSYSQKSTRRKHIACNWIIALATLLILGVAVLSCMYLFPLIEVYVADSDMHILSRILHGVVCFVIVLFSLVFAKGLSA